MTPKRPLRLAKVIQLRPKRDIRAEVLAHFREHERPEDCRSPLDVA